MEQTRHTFRKQFGRLDGNSHAWAVLGALRFALASIVVFGHLARFVPADSITNKVFIKIGLLDPVEAVICFLIISGFSIAHSYSSRPDGYFRRRALRIYPLYVVGVLLAIVPFSIPSPIIEIVGASRPQAACRGPVLE